MLPCSRSPCSCSETPAPFQAATRRQQVTPEPKPSSCPRRLMAGGAAYAPHGAHAALPVELSPQRPSRPTRSARRGMEGASESGAAGCPFPLGNRPSLHAAFRQDPAQCHKPDRRSASKGPHPETRMRRRRTSSCTQQNGILQAWLSHRNCGPLCNRALLPHCNLRSPPVKPVLSEIRNALRLQQRPTHRDASCTPATGPGARYGGLDEVAGHSAVGQGADLGPDHVRFREVGSVRALGDRPPEDLLEDVDFACLPGRRVGNGEAGRQRGGLQCMHPAVEYASVPARSASSLATHCWWRRTESVPLL